MIIQLNTRPSKPTDHLHVSAGDDVLNFGQNFPPVLAEVFDALPFNDDRHHLFLYHNSLMTATGGSFMNQQKLDNRCQQ
jgi:hypothetical protein